MADRLDARMLREVGLTSFDNKMLRLLMQNGGEVQWWPDAANPLARLCVDHMVARNLVELRQPSPGRTLVCLTDFGRRIAGQVEMMDMRPKLEIVTG